MYDNLIFNFSSILIFLFWQYFIHNNFLIRELDINSEFIL